MALAAGMSPRGTANNFLLYSCYQLMMLDDLGPIISGEGGERSRCLDSNPARLRFFFGRILATGLWLVGTSIPKALRVLLLSGAFWGQQWGMGREDCTEKASCPQAGHQETTVRRSQSCWDPGAGGRPHGGGETRGGWALAGSCMCPQPHAMGPAFHQHGHCS